jgi:hypothetical protein
LDIVSTSGSFHMDSAEPFHRSRRSWRMIQTFSRIIPSRVQVALQPRQNK